MIVLIAINPSKLNIFKDSENKISEAQELKSININKEAQYVTYKTNLIVYDKKKIESISSDGKTEFSVNLNMKDYKISSNYYIDVLNKDNLKVLSIDEKGNIIFTEKVPPQTILYKSINDHFFVTVYKKDNKEYIKIQDEQRNVNTEFEYKNKITGIYKLGNDILVSDIQTKDMVSSSLTVFDENGNQKSKLDFDDTVIDVSIQKNYIYVVFLDKIVILDFNLNEKSEVESKDIRNVFETNHDYIYIVDKDKNLSYIDKLYYKKSNNNEKADKISSINNSYIKYLTKTLYNSRGEKLIEFNQNIKDIINIDNKSVAVIFNNYLEIVKLC